MPAISGVSTVRCRTSGFGLNPETSGRDSLSPGKYDLPGNFSIFRENYQSPLQGFQYTNHIEKLAEGRIVASDLVIRQIERGPGILLGPHDPSLTDCGFIFLAPLFYQ